LSTGIQISGKFTRVIDDENYQAIYYQTTGKSALAYKNKELIGHGVEYHSEGFGSPVGKLKGINLAIEDMSPTDLEAYGIYEGKQTTLNFKRGISVTGEIITGKRNLQGKIILISFKNCTVKYGDEILFHPDWGIYDMAIGANVVSAYAGVADPDNYGLHYDPPKEKTHKIKYSKEDLKIHELYQSVREMRESDTLDFPKLAAIFEQISQSEEWLLGLEIYELIYETQNELKTRTYQFLINLMKGKYGNLIKDGLELIK
jgi:phenylalanine-4-hydroxylase